MNTHSIIPNDVKMSLTWGKFAWVLFNFHIFFGVIKFILLKFKYLSKILFTNLSKNKIFKVKNPSETKHSAFYSGIIKNNRDFNEWLVGVTDGDGTFY
jgi:hypothetical protein